jgi:hypothetical protein
VTAPVRWSISIRDRYPARFTILGHGFRMVTRIVSA